MFTAAKTGVTLSQRRRMERMDTLRLSFDLHMGALVCACLSYTYTYTGVMVDTQES